jgi:predicted GNAT superfamily acetyltransferase
MVCLEMCPVCPKGMAMIAIRACEGFDELEACVQLQIATWGYDALEVLPGKAFLVAQKIGGQVIGAFDTELAGSSPLGGPESLVGFTFSLPGIKSEVAAPLPGGEQTELAENPPEAYLHSHMLAVREGWRDRGIGTLLKRQQRTEALGRGIRRIEWTFDPLESKNAYLNIHKLGAIVRSYRENFYGVSSSQLQGGLPTDRLLAEWRIHSPRVKAILEDRPVAAHGIVERIRIPASIYTLKATDRDQALALQKENGRKFRQAFAQGLAVLGFVRDAESNGIFELGIPTEQEADESLRDVLPAAGGAGFYS